MEGTILKTLYLDLGMGAAGDMLSAALSELIEDRDAVIKRLNSVFAPYAVISAEDAKKSGIHGTHINVTALGKVEGESDSGHDHLEHRHDNGHDDHSHSHVSLKSVREFISNLDLPESVISDALAVYDIIADAEAHVHNMPMDNIHFHEVGSVDAMADIVMVCYLMHLIAPDKVIASPIHTGSGTVKCAHGILPVPAPATAHILTGIPSYQGDIRGELCTPTGAALVKHFADDFGPMPVMTTTGIGYGCGTKEFEQANVLRVTLGEQNSSSDVSAHKSDIGYDGTIIELACNIDDMTGEDLGYAAEKLLEAGARDVYFTHITGKKSRPAIILSVLCAPEDEERMAQEIFRLTTTIGIRRYECPRYELKRRTEKISTPLGDIRMKISEGYDISKSKPEFEDIKALAEPIRE